MWQELNVFLIASRSDGLSAAATQLGVQPSSVSRAIARLEQHLGFRLFERTSRALSMTAEAEVLRTSIAPHLDAIANASEALRLTSMKVGGMLRIAAPQEIASIYVRPVIEKMLRENTDVRFELEATARLPDPINASFDIFVSHRREEVLDGTLRCSLLAETKNAIYAAPSLIERLGVPEHPGDLQKWPCLRRLGEAHWRFENERGEHLEIEPSGSISATPGILRIEFALAGHGAVLASQDLCAGYIRSGGLIRLLPDWTVDPTRIFLFLPSGRLTSPAARVFIKHLKDQCGS